jgi:hypothetical protein
MNRGQDDPDTLRNRVDGWRREAATVTLQALREFCLAEAEKCELILRQSKQRLPAPRPRPPMP